MHFVCFGRGNSMHCLLRLRSLPTLSMVGTFGESRLHVLRTPSPFKTFRFEREALDGLCVYFSVGFFVLCLSRFSVSFVLITRWNSMLPLQGHAYHIKNLRNRSTPLQTTLRGPPSAFRGGRALSQNVHGYACYILVGKETLLQ